MKNTKTLHYIILVLILLFALGVRAWDIETTPPGIYPDEANNGTNAYDAQASGDYAWFYPDNNGREGLYINMIGWSFKLFGVSITTLKLTSIFFGVLTVLGVYLMTRELFHPRLGQQHHERDDMTKTPLLNHYRIALIASFLTAASFWAINFSRIGFRAIMLPAVLTFAFYLILRGLRAVHEHSTQQQTHSLQLRITYYVLRLKPLLLFALAGFIFGIGLHTYIAFRIAPLILVVLFVALLLTQQHVIRTYWKGILVFSLFAFLSAAPLLWTFATQPDLLSARTGDVSILSEEINGGNLFGTLVQTLGLSLAKYNFWGDQNWRHGFPPYPTLEPLVSSAFLIGLLYSIIQFFRSIAGVINCRRAKHLPAQKNTQKLIIHSLLLSWFVLLLAPEFMTAEGLPHALRAMGTLPVVYIFAALAIELLLRKAEHTTGKPWALFALPIICLALFYVGLFNTIKYHVFWAQHPKVAVSFDKPLTDIAYHLPTLPEEQTKYIIAGPLARLPVRLLNTQTPNVVFLYDNELDRIDDTENFVILMSHRNEELITQLTKRFPQLTVTEEKRTNSRFFVVEIE